MLIKVYDRVRVGIILTLKMKILIMVNPRICFPGNQILEPIFLNTITFEQYTWLEPSFQSHL